ncbi:MAG: serine/threonine protein kinase [Deltaproteobacteria bacterium]|nr:serine/threonine protein kinase [Deltaproteobacteria bacterium]
MSIRRASRPAVEALFGQVVDGEFEILDTLGAGSHADVFLARQRSVGGRRLAIKMLSYLYLSLPEADGRRAAAAMLREAELLGHLQSPCFVKVYRTGSLPDRRPYIAMELAEGPTLQQVMASKPSWEPAQMVAVLRQWAEGLAELHARGWVHRDVTPANCVVGESINHGMRVQTYDLGTASALAGRPDRFAVGWEKERPPGTPAYMSPEQALGQVVDARADQFALALIAFEWLAGARAIPADASRASVVLDYLRGDGPIPHQPLRTFRSEMPRAVDDVFARALHRDPAHRYADTRGFVNELANHLPGTRSVFTDPSLFGRLLGRLTGR